MNMSNGLLGGSLGLLLTVLASPLGASSVDQAAAVAATRGWLAEGQTRLAGKMPAQVKTAESFGDFYVVRLAPEGYVVTSADDEVEPIIAFSSTGHFQADPENPLWLLLQRDLPARLAHVRALNLRQPDPAGTGKLPATDPDAQALTAIKQNQAKWSRLCAKPASPPPTPAQDPGRMFDDDDPPAPRPAVRVQAIRVANGGVGITHNSPCSVSIQASYDEGRSWQTLDSGVFQPTWISARAGREAAALFRVVEDGLLDEMQVEFMRHPPPPTQNGTDMPGEGDDGPGTDPLAAANVASVSDVRIAPLLQSRWSQSTAQGQNCYNRFTPNNYVCGCVATALAQLTRYWQHPVAGIGLQARTVLINGTPTQRTTRGGNGSGGPYNWGLMPLAPGSSPYNASQWDMIGSLCYDAGVGVNMQYASGGSGAYMYVCASALTGVFGYANARYTYPPNLLVPINSNLQAGYPVLLGIDASGSYGHAIVCDGYGYESGTMYHHLNLGWGGSWDLWYTLPNIGGPYPWNAVHCIIFNVFPTGTGELISGRITTTQGVPVQGATVTTSASGQNYTGTSDAKGYYGVKIPAARSYSVTASKAGMSSVTRSGVSVGTSSYSTCGNAANVDFALNPFSITAVALTNSVWLRWTAPTNCGMANNTAYIRWRTDRYPSSASDGTEVYAGDAQVFEHKPVDGSGVVTNYYVIWGNDGSPYASLGGAAQASACADPGSIRLFWTSKSAGQAVAWQIKADGTKRSGGYVGGVANGWMLSGIGDVDHDGVADLIWHNATLGKVACWLLNADGTKRSGGSVGDLGAGWTLAGARDIDRDGTADLIWHNATLSKVAYWLLNLDGSKRSGGPVGDVTAGWVVAGVADVDGDGTGDVLWHNPTQGKTCVWFLNGNGTKRSGVNMGDVAAGWQPVGVGDVDRDHVPDLIWYSASQARVVCWFLNPNGTKRASAAVGSSVAGWTLVAAGDINSDGTTDLFWQNTSAGNVNYWILNADGTKRSGGPASTAAVGWSLSACTPF